MDKALIIGLKTTENISDVETSLDELEQLALATDIKTIEKIIQQLPKPTANFWVGSGKVQEIKTSIEVLDIDVVIFDTTLSPGQIRNLEKELEVQIMDRSFLILQIFAQRSKTRESVLEIDLAQKLYLLPRLNGMSSSLSRQGGGTHNSRGPGETKLELDKRKIVDDITKIKKELAIIKKSKEVGRQKRLKNKIPVVALVGYTNAGKSATMNTLTSLYSKDDKEKVFEKNMLFATLDTKNKRIKKDNYPPFILVDTVGFVSKLPHELVNSFESTLSDALNADLLVHIVDGSKLNKLEMDTTRDVLMRLGASTIDQILVLTKKDISLITPNIDEDYIWISNKTNENVDILINTIYNHIYNENRIFDLKIPFDRGDVFNYLKENNTIIMSEFRDDGTYVRVSLNPNEVESLKEFIQ